MIEGISVGTVLDKMNRMSAAMSAFALNQENPKRI